MGSFTQVHHMKAITLASWRFVFFFYRLTGRHRAQRRRGDMGRNCEVIPVTTAIIKPHSRRTPPALAHGDPDGIWEAFHRQDRP